MDTNVVYSGEIELMLKLAIVTYIDFAKAMPSSDGKGTIPHDCIAGACRDSGFPRTRCAICDRSVRGELDEAMQALIGARRTRRRFDFNAAEALIGGAKLATAADIQRMFDLITRIHDETTAVALKTPSISADDVEPIRTGRRGGKQTQTAAA